MIDSFRGEYYFLSNFYNAPVTYDGITYLNAESAFQAQKCSRDDLKWNFTCTNGAEAKKLGRTVPLPPDWETMKVGIMYGVVYAKFSQNPALAQALLSTGGEPLVEGNTWGDRVWGMVDGVGENFLGKILMDVRSNLSSEA